jgi:hypothetical protein
VAQEYSTAGNLGSHMRLKFEITVNQSGPPPATKALHSEILRYRIDSQGTLLLRYIPTGDDTGRRLLCDLDTVPAAQSTAIMLSSDMSPFSS